MLSLFMSEGAEGLALVAVDTPRIIEAQESNLDLRGRLKSVFGEIGKRVINEGRRGELPSEQTLERTTKLIGEMGFAEAISGEGASFLTNEKLFLAGLIVQINVQDEDRSKAQLKEIFSPDRELIDERARTVFMLRTYENELKGIDWTKQVDWANLESQYMGMDAIAQKGISDKLVGWIKENRASVDADGIAEVVLPYRLPFSILNRGRSVLRRMGLDEESKYYLGVATALSDERLVVYPTRWFPPPDTKTREHEKNHLRYKGLRLGHFGIAINEGMTEWLALRKFALSRSDSYPAEVSLVQNLDTDIEMGKLLEARYKLPFETPADDEMAIETSYQYMSGLVNFVGVNAVVDLYTARPSAYQGLGAKEVVISPKKARVAVRQAMRGK